MNELELAEYARMDARSVNVQLAMITDEEIAALRDVEGAYVPGTNPPMLIGCATLFALIERLDAAERLIELSDEETPYVVQLGALRAWQATTGRVPDPKPLDWCIADTLAATPPEPT